MNPPILELENLIGIVLSPVALVASGAAIAAIGLLILAEAVWSIVDRG